MVVLKSGKAALVKAERPESWGKRAGVLAVSAGFRVAACGLPTPPRGTLLDSA